MQYRRLGRTHLQVSLVGLGTGGANRLGKRDNRPDADAYRILRHALDQGINVIDTAPAYQDSERLIGEALAGVPRDTYVLSTKFQPGRPAKPQGSLRDSLENSLRLLRTDHVDVMYLHGVRAGEYRAVVDRFLPELQQAQHEGLTRFIGITEATEHDPLHESLHLALDEDIWDVMMVGHNLLAPQALTEVLPRAQAQDVGIMIMCAVRSVISSPELLRNQVAEWKAEGLLASDSLPEEDPLGWVLDAGAESMTAAAYAFAAEHPAASTVLTGTANPKHLDENVRAVLGPPLPREVSQRLQDTFIPVGRAVLPPFMRAGA